MCLRFLFIFLLSFSVKGTNASDGFIPDLTELQVIFAAEGTENIFTETPDNRPNPIAWMIKKQQKKNKRLICAALAFPFPFGIVGLHRIYMGCAPHVPVVYIASLGGVFGILPLIDFFVLVFDKDLERYMNNPKVFMWVD